MKTIIELRNIHNLKPVESSTKVSYFAKQNIDWNVYLPTKKKNLQRDFVWNLDQKRQLIQSVLIGRHIPHCAIINKTSSKDEDIWQIIDGKQRLSALLDFYNNLFTIEIEGKEYFYDDLPDDYKTEIKHYRFRYYSVDEHGDQMITDEQKINWFKFINFAGTPQDEEHIKGL